MDVFVAGQDQSAVERPDCATARLLHLNAEPAISRFCMWVHDGLEAYKGQRFFVWNYTKCSGLALNSRRHCKELCAS